MSPVHLSDITNGVKGMFHDKEEMGRFQRELEMHFRVKYAFLVSSGKAALSIILQALHALHPERDRVLIPALTCYSVPSSIARAGLKVRLCDIDADTLDFDYSRLESILHPRGEQKIGCDEESESSGKVLCIIPTSLYGLPPEVERVRSSLNDSGISVVEDAAQAMGADLQGEKIGTRGDAGFFSLGRGKALTTVSGGIIVTNRDDIAEKIAAYCTQAKRCTKNEVLKMTAVAAALTFMVRPSMFWLPKAIPFLRLGETFYDPEFPIQRMSSFQAGMSRGWEEKLAEARTARAENCRYWHHALEEVDGFEGISKEDGLQSLIRYPILAADSCLRNRALAASEKQGLGIMPTYPEPINNGIPQGGIVCGGEGYPVAEKVSKRLITLPVHEMMRERDRKKIRDVLFRATN